jgi:D-sedoheptulose 7-phosphate isomerase
MSAKIERWDDYVASACAGLSRMAVTDRDGQHLGAADGFARWIAMTREVHARDRNIYLVGNGASAAMASHFATDACKNGHLRAQAFNDPSLLTATGNDLMFEQIFALPLTRLARAGDLLVTISCSGSSPNVVHVLERARAMDLRMVTLSGKRPDNPSRYLGDLNFYVPNDRYGWVESAHHIVLHYWLDQYLNLHGEGAV